MPVRDRRPSTEVEFLPLPHASCLLRKDLRSEPETASRDFAVQDLAKDFTTHQQDGG